MIAYDLQFFAKEGPGGEKTEEPTAKKLEDARKEGQVAKSREIANAAGLIALFLILKFGMGFLGERFLSVFSFIYDKIPQVIKMENGFVQTKSFYALLQDTLIDVLIAVAPFLSLDLLWRFCQICCRLNGKSRPSQWHPNSAN